MKRWIFLIVLGVAGAFIFRRYGFEGVYVASPSMEPTLLVGSNYFVDKITFQFRSPRRREVIVFTSPVEDSKDLIKRVIGLPGETISIKDKQVFINHEVLKEPYVKYKRKNEILKGDNILEMKIPAGCYFVMGDNRDESNDSASWRNPKTGEPAYFVHREEIQGRLINTLE